MIKKGYHIAIFPEGTRTVTGELGKFKKGGFHMAINTKTYKPKIHTIFGGLSGPAIKPIALANVHKLYKSLSIPIIGIIASIVALIGATTATIWQKKFTNKLPLSINNFYQAVAAAIFLFFISVFFEVSYINFTNSFILSMSWQIIMVSFGAMTFGTSIYIYSTSKLGSKKSSAFIILIPVIALSTSVLILNEPITLSLILGGITTIIAVYILNYNR